MIFKKFKETLSRYKLLEKGDKVLIAYSGGLDSTALLMLFLELRQELGLELSIAHFNHKLRPRAEEDEQFARNVARKHSLPIFVGRRDVRCFARTHKLNLEEAGRELRYHFLRKKALKIGATKIATGHTMNDQAETFLMRLLRGSGPRGLGSISRQVGGTIIRPLLGIERKEIEEFLKRKGIAYRIDESNFDCRFLRNRIRLELIPYLQKNFEPKIIPLLSRVASLLEEEDNLLEEIGREKFRLGIREKNNQLFLDVKFLRTLHPALARRCVRNFISELKGDLRGISFADVESILKLNEGREHQLGKGLVLQRERGSIFLKEKTPQTLAYEHLWNGKSTLEIKEVGIQFKGRKMGREKALPFQFNDEERAFLDWRQLEFPILVRSREKGDKYQPLGAPGKKKLKEIMRAKGIPVSEREKRPVFLSSGKIIWVLGLPVSEEFKVSRKTAEIFAIKKL